MLAGVVLVLALATAVGMWLLRPTGVGRPTVKASVAVGVQYMHGDVTAIAPLSCDDFGAPPSLTHPSAKDAKCGRAQVKLTSGPEQGSVVTVDLPPDARRAGVGVSLVIMKVPGPGEGSPYTFYDIERGTPLALLVAAFALTVVVVARWRGLRSLIGLALAAAVVVEYLLPGLLEGHNPVALGLVSSAAIMIVVLYVAHGVSARTTTALLGTFAGLGITAGMGALAVAWAHLNGVSSDDNAALQQAAQQLDLRNLLTCGIILAGLGILNDVTITQSSAVWELYDAAPHLPPLRLYRQAMRIGRDHIASTVYTVVFAYAGAALPVLLLISLVNQPVSRILTSADISEEIVRTMASGIGLVLAVPATTALATLVVRSLQRAEARSAEQVSAPRETRARVGADA
ncbi:YibE/F family protein [Pedococcus badiiscoriae]|uniref:YibE/F family protein n=1 Tax=Pedococcus badiiscoriae TaxID=642776 RepID=UPI0015C72717